MMASDDMRMSKISVWWDIENCPVPRNVDPHLIAQNVSSAVHQANLKGPVTIDAFGDTKHLEQKTLEALSSTGITINHIPSGNKDAADKAILVAMLFWALDNPPPAHFLLISGDGDFANALHRLRMKRYNILLARPDQPIKPALLGAATSVWYWTSIAKGLLSALEHLDTKDGPVSKSVSVKKPSGSGGHSLSTLGSATFKWPNGNVRTLSSFGSTACQGMQLKQGLLGSISSSSLPPSVDKREVSRIEPTCSSRLDNSFDLKDLFPDEKKHGEGIYGEVDMRIDQSIDLPAPKSLSDQELNLQENMPSSCPHSGAQQGADPNTRFLKPTDTQLNFPTKLQSSSPMGRGAVYPSSHDLLNGHVTKLHTEEPERTARNIAEEHNSSVDLVRKALRILSQDGLSPTEVNLQECMCFLDKKLKEAHVLQMLQLAVKQGDIVELRNRPGGLRMFLPLNSRLWECINIEDMHHEYPDEVWMDLHNFLCCADACRMLLKSKSKYEAARILKDNVLPGIQCLSVAEIMRLLNQAIRKKKWLRLDGTEWPCLCTNLDTATNYYRTTSKSLGSKPDVSSAKQNCVGGKQRKPIACLTVSEKLQKLRGWLLETSSSVVNYDISGIRKDFESDTGIYLDPTEFGCLRFHELLDKFSDIVCTKEVRKGLLVLCPVKHNGISKPPYKAVDKKVVVDVQSNTSKQVKGTVRHTANPILERLKAWLIEVPSLNTGYDISLIKKDFLRDTGVTLDPESLGYSKIKDIVCEFSDLIRMESPRKGYVLLYRNLKGHVPQAVSSCKSETAKQWKPVQQEQKKTTEIKS